MKFYFCRTEYLTLKARVVDLEQASRTEPQAEVSFSLEEVVDERGNVRFGEMVQATMKAMQQAAAGLAPAGISPFSEPVEFQFAGTVRGLSADKKDVIVNIEAVGGKK